MKASLCRRQFARFATAFALTLGLVVSANAQTVLFDFGNDDSFRGLSVPNPDFNGNYWNSFRTGTFNTNLIDINNDPTTIDFGFSTVVATDSYNGPAGPTDGSTLLFDVTFTDIDPVALGNLGGGCDVNLGVGSCEAAFDYVAGGPGAVRFEIQQLDPTKTYDLTFFGSHKYSTDSTTIYNVYTDNTYTTLVDTVSLDHQDLLDPFFHNRDTVATISGLAPQTSNILYVEFVGDQGNPGYLNSLELVGTGGAPTSTISDFNNFNLAGTFDSWDTATLTSGPDSYRVQSSEFGGGFASVPPNFVGTNNTHVELDVTVTAGDEPNVVALLQDGDGTQYLYRFDTLAAGDHTLSFPLNPIGLNFSDADSFEGIAGTEPGLDLATIGAFQIQVDPHGSPDAYDVSYNNLRLKNVPGSFDTDEDVDGADFLQWQRGLSPEALSGTDLATWRSRYGMIGEVPAVVAASSSLQAVPEPTTAGLLLLGSVALLALERRSRNLN